MVNSDTDIFRFLHVPTKTDKTLMYKPFRAEMYVALLLSSVDSKNSFHLVKGLNKLKKKKFISFSIAVKINLHLDMDLSGI